MPQSKTKLKSIMDAFYPIIELYRSLTIDQCVELYLQQHDNMEQWQKKIILSIIGAKTVYKDEYVPSYYKKLKEQENKVQNEKEKLEK